MAAAVDWANLSTAAAFIVGAVFGAVATIRLARALLVLFEQQRRRRRDD